MEDGIYLSLAEKGKYTNGNPTVSLIHLSKEDFIESRPAKCY